MRHLFFAASTFALAASVFASDVPAQPAAPEPRIHNIAQSFADFWDANKDKPAAEQLAAFNKEVSAGFPAFYGVERYSGKKTQAEQDARIAKAIKEFPEIREGYLHKAHQFDTELPRYVASFQEWFPDYRIEKEIYVLHSLGEMDGGTRSFNGKNYLIFGIDGMVRYHGKGNESAFFHHELFHTYHGKAMDACDSDNQPMWMALWNEGLATYVSKVMNPQADDTETMLEFPNGMATRTKKVLPAAFAHLEEVLDRTDDSIYVGLFNGRDDGTGLPPRRGYYLGYLVAAEAAKHHDVRELARLECGKVRELVVPIVHELRVKHQSASAQATAQR